MYLQPKKTVDQQLESIKDWEASINCTTVSGETNVRLMVVSKAFIDGDKADYAFE